MSGLTQSNAFRRVPVGLAVSLRPTFRPWDWGSLLAAVRLENDDTARYVRKPPNSFRLLYTVGGDGGTKVRSAVAYDGLQSPC